MNELFMGEGSGRIRWAVFAAVVLLAVFLAIQAIAGLMGLRFIGSGLQATNTITVSGTGDAYAVPDTGEFTFSVVSDKATVADAQADATAKINVLTQYLKGAGVADADIKTVDYSVSPQYEYSSAVCPQVSSSSGAPIYCPPGKQTLKGYEVRQTTDVKVRDTSKAGDLLAGVGSRGATEVSGLNFTVDDPTAVQDEARTKAIADAKTKADELAKELGVTLVRVTSFSENNGGYPVPMYSMTAASGGEAKAAVAPDISTGQNKVTSNVTVTYEIR